MEPSSSNRRDLRKDGSDQRISQLREIMKARACAMTIQITRPEVEALITRRLQTGSFKDAEDVILQALQSSETEAQGSDAKRREAIERLMAFGKTHGLSLGGMTIRELRDEARP